MSTDASVDSDAQIARDLQAAYDLENSQNVPVSSNDDDKDILAEKLEKEKAALAKWRRKLSKCACCLKLIAILFMACAAW